MLRTGKGVKLKSKGTKPKESLSDGRQVVPPSDIIKLLQKGFMPEGVYTHPEGKWVRHPKTGKMFQRVYHVGKKPKPTPKRGEFYYPKKMANALSSEINNEVDHMVEQIIVQTTDGTRHLKVTGTKSSVTFSPFEWNKTKKAMRGKDVLMVHNHPERSTFSPADIITALGAGLDARSRYVYVQVCDPGRLYRMTIDMDRFRQAVKDAGGNPDMGVPTTISRGFEDGLQSIQNELSEQANVLVAQAAAAGYAEDSPVVKYKLTEILEAAQENWHNWWLNNKKRLKQWGMHYDTELT